MLNLSSIKLKTEQIKMERKTVYRKIFKKICNTIKLNAEEGRNWCIFQVPSFIFDEISYPLNECLEYIDSKMYKIEGNKQIIDVSFYQPNIYYFKWKL